MGNLFSSSSSEPEATPVFEQPTESTPAPATTGGKKGRRKTRRGTKKGKSKGKGRK